MSKCVFCDSGIQLDWYEKGLALHLVEGLHEACLNQGEAEFPEDFQERTGKTVSKLLAMPLGEAIPLLKQGDGSPLSRLLSYQDFDGPIPRGADTLCATCYEHGACRDWVVDAAGGACLELGLYDSTGTDVLSYIATKVLDGEYSHNTSIAQIVHGFRADVIHTTEV